MYDAFEAYSSGHHLLNFQSEAGNEVVKASFGDNYARLTEVKRKYDPQNFFSLNQNIPGCCSLIRCSSHRIGIGPKNSGRMSRRRPIV